MCRPTKQRRVSLIEDIEHVDRYIDQKVALHQECQTASTSVLSSDDTVSICSQHCPVTGRYSDINADYSISNLVFGSGHYGTVRQCIHRATGQAFAVKSIEKSKVNNINHLQREIHLLSTVKHENVMNMIDCYEDENSIHIVSEKFTGGELFDKIIARSNTAEIGCFSELEAARIIKQLIKAVAYLHENNICHRDIKPENILFESKDEDSRVKLIDFGLSRQAQQSETMSNPVGTAYYMSPELLKGSYDRATDMWSVGVVAYILLCGYPPFNGNSDYDIASAIRRGHYTFEDEWSDKSNESIDFIKCLLKRDPRRRYTAEDALKHPWLQNADVMPMEL